VVLPFSQVDGRGRPSLRLLRVTLERVNILYGI